MRNFFVILFLTSAACPLQAQALQFRALTPEDGIPNAFWADDIIEDSRGYVWIGSKSGLLRYDGYEMQLFAPNPNDPTALKAFEIQTLKERSNGEILIGSLSSGINHYDPNTGYFHQCPVPETRNLRIWDFHEHGGSLWMATEGRALVQLHLSDSTVTFHAPDVSDSDFYLTFRTIVQDRSDTNRLWLGSRAGLFSFDCSSHSFRLHPMPVQSIYGKDFMITSAEQDVDGKLWLGTYWGGLMSFDPAANLWKQMRFHDQFPALNEGLRDVAHDVLLLHQGPVLVATSGGLLAYHKDDDQFTLIDTLLERNLYLETYLTSRGQILACGVGPVVSISDPISQDAFPLPFKPYIWQIRVDLKPLPVHRAIEVLPKIVMNESDRDLSLQFSSPELIAPSAVKYAYRLAGYDRDWIYGGDRRYVSYTNLRAGKYTFEYRASYDDINWVSGNPLSIEKVVPFWKHALFIPGIGLFLLLLIVTFAHLRITSIRKHAALTTQFNKRLMEVELSALRAQMNPHFMFNSLNSIKYYILKNQNEEANRYLTKFSQLMRSVLKASKSKLILLAEELHALRLYVELESLRFTENGFAFHIEIGSNVDPESMYLPPLLVQPYVENAIWHGLLHKDGPGTLWVRINKNGKALFIEIEDDGIGREAAKQRKSKSATKNKSYGMQITSSRIALVKETFGIESKVDVIDLLDASGHPAGTRVILEIPLISEEHYEQLLESSNP
ncbi:MAG: histidine kinase [Saprospiraceae bacterium]|nr:histidine kinase [Saprospiraceae bacterium]